LARKHAAHLRVPSRRCWRTSSIIGAAWQRLLYGAGYAGLSWPKEYGGGGSDAKLRAVFNEELDRAGAPERLNIVGEDFAGPTIIQFGTPAQQERYLESILTGDEIWCQLFSEPAAGSDLASLRTSATSARRMAHPGAEDLTSRAQLAAHAILLARTGSSPAQESRAFPAADGQPRRRRRAVAHMGEAEFNEVPSTTCSFPTTASSVTSTAAGSRNGHPG
jgi:alkylation response protein AidB-like acyl-CoA dehydrogenase